VPDYDQKHIRSIVEYLFRVGDTQTYQYAKHICNVYAGKQFDFLKDIERTYRTPTE